MRRLCIAFLAALVVPVAWAAPAEAKLNASEKAVITKSNEHRAVASLKPVAHQRCLEKYAEAHAKQMAKKKKMYHQSTSKLKAIMKKCKLKRIGENVARGYTSSTGVTTAWMNSASHRANILRPSHRRIGIAVHKGKDGQKYWTQLLGTPR